MTEKTARKRKAPVPKVREAAREYRTKSQDESLGEAFLATFRALPEDARDAFLTKLLEGHPELREDIYDSIIAIESRGEPTRPYREIREELIRDGLL